MEAHSELLLGVPPETGSSSGGPSSSSYEVLRGPPTEFPGGTPMELNSYGAPTGASS